MRATARRWRQAAQAVTVLYENMIAEGGLHATQYTALQLIEAAPNLATTDLAEAMGARVAIMSNTQVMTLIPT